MKSTTLKKYLNKYCVVKWNDPSTYPGYKLEEVDFSKKESNGLLVEVNGSRLILKHESSDEEGDFTIIHPVLVTEIKKIK